MKRLGLAIIMIVWFSQSGVFASPVGTLLLETGILKVRRNSVDMFYNQIGASITIQNDDEIQTGPKTKVLIRLDESNDEIELFSNTFYTITVPEKKLTHYLPLGKARFKTINIKKHRRKRAFRLRTINAMISVKGTEFIVGVGENGTSLLTLEGSVIMVNISAPDIPVIVPVNRASRVRQNKPPSEPIKVHPRIVEAIVSGDDAKDFDVIPFSDDIYDSEKGGKRKKSQDTQKDDTKRQKDRGPESSNSVEENLDDHDAESEVMDNAMDEII